MSRFLEALRETLHDRVRTDDGTLARHRHDAWVLSELHDLEGRPAARPLAVVEASSTEDVAATLRLCRAHGVAVVPFGGGSGVCGSTLPGADAVVLSTRRMDGLVAIDDRDLTARFRAGTLGIDAERRVQEAGLTIGHWPQSVEISTVGGWVATRAAGQFSTAYGNIEDVLLGLEAVLPDGSIVRTRETPRASAGPDLRQLFLGSEGTLGVVTEVTFSLRPLPERSEGRAFHFASFDAGLDAIRKLIRAGWRPPVVRLYDARESRRHFRDATPKGRAMLILLHEGPDAAVGVEIAEVTRSCVASEGSAADSAVVKQWLASRNHVPSFRSFLEQGVIVDTIEIAATWSRVGDVYERVTRSLGEVPGILSATAHSSHSYRSGTNLYFSFAVKPDERARMAAAYRECWDRTIEATLVAGGGIAHHPGVGRVRRDHLAGEIGQTGVDLLRAIKRTLDPGGLLNPGNLLPPDAGG
jgi:alkyldihydroxyacetonephosphate synthase